MVASMTRIMFPTGDMYSALIAARRYKWSININVHREDVLYFRRGNLNVTCFFVPNDADSTELSELSESIVWTESEKFGREIIAPIPQSRLRTSRALIKFLTDNGSEITYASAAPSPQYPGYPGVE